LDFCHLGADGSGAVVTTTSKLDVEPGGKNGADEASLDCRWCHTSDHNGRFAKKTGVRGIDVNGAVTKRSSIPNLKQ
jgi:hypothetical protein